LIKNTSQVLGKE